MSSLARLLWPSACEDVIDDKTHERSQDHTAMTVCIAVHARDAIVTAVDMATTDAVGNLVGDNTQKTFHVGDGKTILTAGNQSINVELMRRTRNALANAAGPVTIHDLAGLWAYECTVLRPIYAAAVFLSPFGISGADLLSSNVSPQAYWDLKPKLDNYHIESQCLVVGHDATGAHIFYAEHAAVLCGDDIGFWTAGSGYALAKGMLQNLAYIEDNSLPTTLFKAYAAKRAAEEVPTVGKRTEMWILREGISPEKVPQQTIDLLDRTYTRTEESIRIKVEAIQEAFRVSAQEALLEFVHSLSPKSEPES